MWLKINETLQNKNKYLEERFLSDVGEMITDQKTMASKFQNYFVNVAKNLLANIGESNNKFQAFLKNSNIHNLFINETDHVSHLLDKINVNHATDIHGILPKLVKMAAGKLIFIYSIEQEIFPEKLKTGLTFPIHKEASTFVC